jgi:hypothetical protein
MRRLKTRRVWLRSTASSALIALILATSSTANADVRFEDILGRWCQNTGGSYTFSKTELNVARTDGSTRVLKIAKAEVKGDQIVINWAPLKANNDTWFEFSADRRIMFQLANATGDMGPRREFRRC